MSRGLRRARGSRTVMKNRCTTDDRLLSSVDAHRSVPGFFNSVESPMGRVWLALLRLQLALLHAEPGYARLRDEVQKIAAALSEKDSIPMVRAQMPLIEELLTDRSGAGL